MLSYAFLRVGQLRNTFCLHCFNFNFDKPFYCCRCYWVCFHLFLFALHILATEIRCQEKSKGGLCYEVILGQPGVQQPPKQNNTTTPTAKNISAEEIERKLREAEERRLV